MVCGAVETENEEEVCKVHKMQRKNSGRRAGKPRLLQAQSLLFITAYSGITPVLSSASSHLLIEEER